VSTSGVNSQPDESEGQTGQRTHQRQCVVPVLRQVHVGTTEHLVRQRVVHDVRLALGEGRHAGQHVGRIGEDEQKWRRVCAANHRGVQARAGTYDWLQLLRIEQAQLWVLLALQRRGGRGQARPGGGDGGERQCEGIVRVKGRRERKARLSWVQQCGTSGRDGACEEEEEGEAHCHCQERTERRSEERGSGISTCNVVATPICKRRKINLAC